MTRARVLIIDDSAYNRTTLARIVDAEPEFEVVDTAADGEEGLRKMLMHMPDVVTLDLDMPRMDGFTFLRICMQKLPIPVVVVSSQAQPENVFKALELGAVDFVAKPTKNISERLNEVGAELIEKLKAAVKTQFGALKRQVRQGAPPQAVSKLAPPKSLSGLIVLGASTGGPGAVQQVLERLPILPVGILIAQHMPAGFTRTFAERLNRTSPYMVEEARGGESVAGGQIWVAPGGRNLAVVRRAGELRLITDEPAGDRFVPSVDKLFFSAAKVGGLPVLAIVLTGMGDDGAQGAVAVRNAGGHLYVESEETAVVNGMPREAARLATAHRVLPLPDFPKAIEQWTLSLKIASPQA
jgi:two-component system chemotaxis response regulator CheB